MPNYANAKIYKIVGDTGATYYGSTTQSLKERMARHRSDKTTTAYQRIISQMDYEIILVENFPCDSKKELLDREGTYIRGNPCVNRQVAGRTEKEWYEETREKRLANKKKYHADHRDEANEYSRRYQRWRYSFGHPRSTNCLQRCDPSLFQ